MKDKWAEKSFEIAISDPGSRIINAIIDWDNRRYDRNIVREAIQGPVERILWNAIMSQVVRSEGIRKGHKI